MNNESIKKYVLPSKGLKVLSTLLLLCALAGLVFGFYSLGAESNSDAVLFDTEKCARGDYAYLDIYGVSEWVFKVDSKTYYAAEDADGYLYILHIGDTEYKNMRLQRAYWDRSSDDTAIASPYRVYGKVMSVLPNVRNGFSQAFEISEDEVDNYFGSTMLDTVNTPGSDRMAIGLIIALICGLCSALTAMKYSPQNKLFKNTFKRYQQLGLTEQVSEAFLAPDAESFWSDNVRIGGNYIFGKSCGSAVRIDDVLWAYGLTLKNTNTLVLCTKEGRIKAAFSKKGESADDILKRINEKNPQALLGYSIENESKFKAMTK